MLLTNLSPSSSSHLFPPFPSSYLFLRPLHPICVVFLPHYNCFPMLYPPVLSSPLPFLIFFFPIHLPHPHVFSSLIHHTCILCLIHTSRSPPFHLCFLLSLHLCLPLHHGTSFTFHAAYMLSPRLLVMLSSYSRSFLSLCFLSHLTFFSPPFLCPRSFLPFFSILPVSCPSPPRPRNSSILQKSGLV